MTFICRNRHNSTAVWDSCLNSILVVLHKWWIHDHITIPSNRQWFKSACWGGWKKTCLTEFLTLYWPSSPFMRFWELSRLLWNGHFFKAPGSPQPRSVKMLPEHVGLWSPGTFALFCSVIIRLRKHGGHSWQWSCWLCWSFTVRIGLVGKNR